MLTPSPSATARWLLAGVILLTALVCDFGGWAMDAVLNFAAFIIALLLTFLELAPWIAERLSLPFLEIYFPTLYFPKPPLSYTLARHYRDQGRLEDAAEQLRTIIRYYPREESAYLELLQVADQMDDHKLGGQYAALYHRRFKTPVPILL